MKDPYRFGCLEIGGRIILKCVFRKLGARVYIEFVCSGKDQIAGCCVHGLWFRKRQEIS